MRVTTTVAATTAATLAVNAAPAVTSLGPLRRRWFPGLAGIGCGPSVGLTFDDGPDPASTPAFLDALDDLGWKATFFMLGRMVRRSPGLAASVAAAGHEVAVHGDSHRSHGWRSPADVGADLERATATVLEATGVRPTWFRPPYGVLSVGSVVAARQLELRPVLWTTWGRDWRARATADSVAADVTRGLRPGGTVLLHDSDCTSAPGAWRSALGCLPALADVFAAQGLQAQRLGSHLQVR
ncbi:MAG: polysaccharide deacetylase family protein [Acidimicrobiales bacterium]